eukprot:CAMPEP_0197177852 /NCGR_PEP_ID=MMETSP1423-20130617/3312_1 /TAXON_ID=476441 /ORGANISM="Pseudo-nitzschia heimii, Strain UNC1101" /LENGTH=207 /DNA_ID=CAMNT_0042627465 /DNA_START=157 /DNA_END=780 /DNA_ORIENTATION=+
MMKSFSKAPQVVAFGTWCCFAAAVVVVVVIIEAPLATGFQLRPDLLAAVVRSSSPSSSRSFHRPKESPLRLEESSSSSSSSDGDNDDDDESGSAGPRENTPWAPDESPAWTTPPPPLDASTSAAGGGAIGTDNDKNNDDKDVTRREEVATTEFVYRPKVPENPEDRIGYGDEENFVKYAGVILGGLIVSIGFLWFELVQSGLLDNPL